MKRIFALAFVLIIMIIILSCGDGENHDSCNGISCSGYGVCAVSNGNPLCVCDQGYKAEGLACVPYEEDGDIDVIDSFDNQDNEQEIELSEECGATLLNSFAFDGQIEYLLYFYGYGQGTIIAVQSSEGLSTFLPSWNMGSCSQIWTVPIMGICGNILAVKTQSTWELLATSCTGSAVTVHAFNENGSSLWTHTVQDSPLKLGLVWGDEMVGAPDQSVFFMAGSHIYYLDILSGYELLDINTSDIGLPSNCDVRGASEYWNGGHHLALAPACTGHFGVVAFSISETGSASVVYENTNFASTSHGFSWFGGAGGYFFGAWPGAMLQIEVRNSDIETLATFSCPDVNDVPIVSSDSSLIRCGNSVMDVSLKNAYGPGRVDWTTTIGDTLTSPARWNGSADADILVGGTNGLYGVDHNAGGQLFNVWSEGNELRNIVDIMPDSDGQGRQFAVVGTSQGIVSCIALELKSGSLCK